VKNMNIYKVLLLSGIMAKVKVIKWKATEVADDGKQSEDIEGTSHPGCCSQ